MTVVGGEHSHPEIDDRVTAELSNVQTSIGILDKKVDALDKKVDKKVGDLDKTVGGLASAVHEQAGSLEQILNLLMGKGK